MKNKIMHIVKQVKKKSFSYGKFVVENYGATKKERMVAINKFLETTRNTTDKKIKNT